VLRQLLNDDIHVGVELLVEEMVGLQVHGTRRLGRVRVQRRRVSPRELPLVMTMSLFTLTTSTPLVS